MKLLAKAPEERYQTAEGVEADFRRCLAEIVSSHRIDPFPLGTHDMADRLLIPERLYGRDRECAALRNANRSPPAVSRRSCWWQATPESANHRLMLDSIRRTGAKISEIVLKSAY